MDKTEKFWDKVAANYYKDEERFKVLQKMILEKTNKYLRVRDSVLDFGCGTGTKTLELADKVKDILGIDISSKMIEIARKKAVEGKIDNVNFTKSTIDDKGFKKESFDVIVAFNILHALEDHQQVIQRIRELLKSGGLFISMTPCLKERMDLLNRFQLHICILLMKTGIFPNMLTKLNYNQVESLISNGNFKIIESEKIFYKLSGCYMVARKI